MESTKKKNFDPEKVKNLITEFICLIVDEPEGVKCYIHESENSVIFELAVYDFDYGKVIGKQGKLAQSLRTMVRAISGSFDKKIILEFSSRKDK